MNSAITGERSKKKRPLWLKVVVVLFVVLVAGGAGVAVRWWQQSLESGKAAEETALADTFSNSFKQSIAGNYDGAHDVVNKALEDNGLSAHSKYQLYMEQGSIYQNQGNYDAALDSYLKADSFESTFNSAESVAYIAELKGNKEQAIDYYKKAITLVPETEGTREDIIKTYQDSITGLGGQL
jgi:tetratricopeptide (TPR) repeat protein